MNFIDNYYGLIKELGEKSNRNSDRKREILIEHKAIIDAILQRDTELGKKMLVYHLSNARENLNKNL